MPKHTKKSKRLKCRTRYKIEKKVREHRRKVKKDAEKKGSRQSKRKKMVSVPKSLPFRDEILQEAHQERQKLELQKQERKRKHKREKLIEKNRGLSDLVVDAGKRAKEFDAKEQKQHVDGKTKSSRSFYKEFQTVVKEADVILEVLDARDPLGTRCPQVEKAVFDAGGNKRLVLLLNKVDLIPKENVSAWLKYLRNELPTVAFKCSTQSQKHNLAHVKIPVLHASDELRESSKCLGANALMKLLKNYSRCSSTGPSEKQAATMSLTVGIVGLPNTGKSSLINSLVRGRSCTVGAVPGVTRAVQRVHLEKGIQLLDSPGVVLASTNSAKDADVLRNCLKADDSFDTHAAVGALLRRCSREQLLLHYKIPDFSNVDEFLVLLAKCFGRFHKGGVPDQTRAARVVLHDWNIGKIRYYTHPPHEFQSLCQLSSDIVQKMGEEFVLKDIKYEEEKDLRALKASADGHMQVESLGPALLASEGQTASDAEMSDVAIDNDNEDDDDSSWEDDYDEDDALHEVENGSADPLPKNVEIEVPMAKRAEETTTKANQGKDSKRRINLPAIIPALGKFHQNKQVKLAMKKQQKKKRKAQKVFGELSAKMNTAIDLGAKASKGAKPKNDDYDFDSDYIMS